MRETEIHIKTSAQEVLIFKEELINKGFIDHGTILQHDRIFNEDCFKEGVKIRIRVEGEKAEITCKSKTNYCTGLQDRSEINIDIKKEEIEKYIKMFEMIGYKVFFQALKKRQKFEKDGIEVVFDKWPLIDELVEIEGEINKIENFVKEVLPNADRGTYTYKEHLELKMKNTGKSLEQLIKEYEEMNHFKLINIEKMFES